MQKWLEDNDILVYLAHNEGNLVVAERFIRALKHEIYNKIVNCKFYLGYLNKLKDGFNYTYHPSIGKKPIDTDYSALTEEIQWSHKTPKFNIGDRARITKYKNVFRKGYRENWSKEIFVIDSV